jgi:hypothetical protein
VSCVSVVPQKVDLSLVSRRRSSLDDPRRGVRLSCLLHGDRLLRCHVSLGQRIAQRWEFARSKGHRESWRSEMVIGVFVASVVSAHRCAAIKASSTAAVNETPPPLLEYEIWHPDSESYQWKCSISRIWTTRWPILTVKYVGRFRRG